MKKKSLKLTVWIVWKSIKHFLTLRGSSRRINNWFSLPETGPEFSSLVSASVSRLTILREIPCNHHSCNKSSINIINHHFTGKFLIISQSNVIVVPRPDSPGWISCSTGPGHRGRGRVFLFAHENVCPHLLFSHYCHIISDQFYALCLQLDWVLAAH